ncbi:hypothetical protein JK169_12865 [Acetobacter persici]|uniref:Uncharacterized protein n=1 Tax=Acetobacter persici TaxID=1076596 RepID=A0A1U9LEX4_9PROT|nr:MULTISPECIES: hypothetical protein [Acetobacter]AQT04994.1 hypothetical protein A0U91_08795 [Acetobacter persici]MBS0963494.1 hypothetical protein [Acetobacter persici]MBS1001887.1 hypothetical protein [Acetobacter persici]MBS1015824.1 hypothetical protein [Acetobacter persici]MCG0998334.1 hypothetical protein [Acetobacter persici]
MTLILAHLNRKWLFSADLDDMPVLWAVCIERGQCSFSIKNILDIFAVKLPNQGQEDGSHAALSVYPVLRHEMLVQGHQFLMP